MTGEYKTFPCGCKFEITGTLPDGSPSFNLDGNNLDNFPFTCEGTWKMLADGYTKGVFQLESRLGKQYCKKLKPNKIEHLAALGSILRPGCLQSLDEDGVSITDHYCKRKNGEEPLTFDDDSLKPILSKTLALMIFQEDLMSIAKNLAGFDDVKVDRLRKIVGKKQPEEMIKIGREFVDEAEKIGVVSREKAQQIWDMMAKSGRYLFNKCILGDTKILSGDPDRENLTVEEMYKTKNYGTSLSLDRRKFLIRNRIVDIQRSGLARLLKITLRNSLSTTVSLYHKFPTMHGEKEACALSTTDFLIVKNEHTINNIHYEQIDKIEEAGAAITYDVTMRAPYHTFTLENGIVTCNSHAVAYGIIGWVTAYLKYHFPIQFFTSYLEMASDKPDPSQEVYELVEEAKLFDIEVVPPDIRHADESKFSIKDGKIYFSLLAIKGLGESHISKVQTLDKEFLKGDWTNFLIHYSDQLSSTTMVRMIETGALRLFKKQRQEMLYEYTQVWSKLTDREKEWVKEYALGKIPPTIFSSANGSVRVEPSLAHYLEKLVEQGSGGKAKGCGCSNKNRLQVCKDLHSLLTNNPVSLIDSPRWIAWCEEEYLGVAITCNKIDEYEVTAPTCTCKEYIKGFKGYIVMGVEIKDMRIFKIKKEGPNQGKEMASITFTDGTATMESVPIFADTFGRFKDIVAPGQFLMLEGERGRGDTFMINHINLLKGHKT